MSHEALGSQFTELFHGSATPGLTEISPDHSNQNYSMTRGGVFSTNHPGDAARYAQDAHRIQGGAGTPVVYEVEHADGDIEPDPKGNDYTYGPEFDSIEEARDHVDSGGYASFRHSGPLRVVREMSPEEATNIGYERGWG